MIPKSYKNREQAFIKHTLLRNYLERLFMIIGQFEREIAYVDCFAGPWQEGSENFSDTSIGISLSPLLQRPRSEYLINFMYDFILEKLDIVQKQVRAETKQQRRIDKNGQQEMFPASADIKDDAAIDLNEVKKYWLANLPSEPVPIGLNKLADMLEETGWFVRDFQRAFNELLDEGKAKNLDAPRKRPIHAVHFEKNEHLVRVK